MKKHIPANKSCEDISNYGISSNELSSIDIDKIPVHSEARASAIIVEKNGKQWRIKTGYSSIGICKWPC
jgi:hypothetical protein